MPVYSGLCARGHSLTRRSRPPAPTATRSSPSATSYRSPTLETLGFSTPTENRTPTPFGPAPRVRVRTPLPPPPPADVRRDPAPAAEERAGLVERLWAESAKADDPFVATDWLEDTAEFRPAPNRWRFRWGVMVTLVAVFIGSLALYAYLRDEPQRVATDLRLEYRQLGAELEATLEDAAAAAAIVTDLTVEPTDLEDPTGSLTAFALAGGRLADSVTAPLPAVNALADPTPIDDLRSDRALLQEASTLATELSDNIAATRQYRVSFADAFALPRLPSIADSDQLTELRDEVALALADTQAIISRLEGGEVFRDHRDLAEFTLERLESWQGEYLDALRRGDQEEAIELAAAARSQINEVQASVNGPLRTAGEALQADFDRLRQLITAGLASVGTTVTS